MSRLTPTEGLYWALWKAACIEQGWVQKDEERRHAVHVRALGRDKSHKEFSHADRDRVFAVLKVLAQPDHVAGQVQLDRTLDPRIDEGERRRLLFRIQQLGSEEYITKIARDKFDTARLSDLDLRQLDMLRLTLIERKRARLRAEKRDSVTA